MSDAARHFRQWHSWPSIGVLVFVAVSTAVLARKLLLPSQEALASWLGLSYCSAVILIVPPIEEFYKLTLAALGVTMGGRFGPSLFAVVIGFSVQERLLLYSSFALVSTALPWWMVAQFWMLGPIALLGFAMIFLQFKAWRLPVVGYLVVVIVHAAWNYYWMMRSGWIGC